MLLVSKMSMAFGIMDNRDALCPGCESLPTVDQLIDHHHVIHDCYEEFLSCDCPFCVWLREHRVNRSIRRFEKAARGVFVDTGVFQDGKILHSMHLNLMFKDTYKFFGSSIFEIIAKPCRYLTKPKHRFDLIRFTADHFSATIRRRDPILDPSSPAAMQIIETWLDECISKHNCPTPGNPPLPTYLVDVGTKDSHEVHLTRTKSGMDYPFVALSYVWGVPQQKTELRKHTIGDMLVKVSEKEIPQTILDAMEITRRLKIRYLWVDSLCIVQDDKTMKSGEIAKMGGIFTGSILTIQAASAETVNQGFLQVRAREDVPEHKLQYSQGSDECVIIRPEQSSTGVHAPTNSRAWCYEESVLPRRLLTFGQDELSFKCRTADHFESGKRLEGRDKSGPGLFTGWKLSDEDLRPPFNGDKRLLILKTWYSSIDFMYSPRLLTKIHDRLLAIEGVARRIQPWAGGRYVAGLWESDLLFGLLWRTSTVILPHLDNSVIDVMRARRRLDHKSVRTNQPSWSWASVDGPVLHTPRRKFVDVIAQVSIPSPSSRERDDPFEAIDGRLCMSAPIRAATLEFGFGEDGARHSRGRVKQEIICSDTGLIQSEIIGQAFLDGWDTGPQSVWCAAVIGQYGLLLELIDESQKRYRRVGLFIMSESHWEMEPKFAKQEKIELEII